MFCEVDENTQHVNLPLQVRIMTDYGKCIDIFGWYEK